MKNLLQITATATLVFFAQTLAHAGNITVLGAGSGSAPIFVTTALDNIDIGTRVRVGTFLDLSALNSAITAFSTGSASYSATLLSLNNNFADLGTNATNYGTTSQTAVGGAAFSPSTTQFGFNNISSLTINGVTANRNVFNGSITGVNYSSSIGASKNLYIWTAFNDQIGIVRNSDGTGTSAWTSPSSDLSGVTMNLSGINSQSEVLLGTYVDYAAGSDLIALSVPEPTTGILLIASLPILLGLRRKSKF